MEYSSGKITQSMKWIFCLLALYCCHHETSAQKQANNWYFGANAGLDFSQNLQPKPVRNSAMNTQEGVATMSDAETGKLLFYSDAVKVWNRENQPMPNSGDDDPRDGVNRGYNALSQGALIVPLPGNPSIYFLFSLIEPDPRITNSKPPGVLTYSRIDMRLDQGKGDVISDDKNTVLADGLVGRLTAVPHTNGRDYWLITHQSGNNNFLVYPITNSGIGRADTMGIGSVIHDKFGYLKASPDGRRLACSSRGTSANPFDLFEFNASNGLIFNYRNLGSFRVGYGVSFSPDNTKLYISTMAAAAENDMVTYPELIRQYDLNAGNLADVIASGKSIVYQNPFTNIDQQKDKYTDFYAPSLQIGPDGRIYCSSNANARLCKDCGYRFMVINNPNEAGFASNVKVQVMNLSPGLIANASDLPNFMQHYFNGLQPHNSSTEGNEPCQGSEVTLAPNPAHHYIDLEVSNICSMQYDLKLTNISGQALYTHLAQQPGSQRINISYLSAGIYFLEIRFKNSKIVKRFFKY